MARTKNFADVIRKKLAGDPDLAAGVEREDFNANVASRIYSARKAQGLTQQQLADRVGTHQSVIARLEDADYEGHSLSMLFKIASALNQRLCIDFLPALAEQVASESQSEGFGSQVEQLPPLGPKIIPFETYRKTVASNASRGSVELKAVQ